MDILYVLDTSATATEEDIEWLKMYLLKSIDDFNVSPKDVRMAFVIGGAFLDDSKSGFLDYQLGSSSIERVKAFIQNIRQQKDLTKSNLTTALRYADTKLRSQRRNDGAEFLMVIVSKDPVSMMTIRDGISAMRTKRPDRIALVQIGKPVLSDSSIGDRELKIISVDRFDELGEAYDKLFKFFATKKGM